MNEERSSRTTGLVAGTALLVLAVLAGFANFVVVQGLVTEGDPARTAADILGSQGLFRLGVLSFYVVVVLDIVVAWGLYQFFAPAQRAASLVTAWFRIIYAGGFLVAAGYLATALEPLTSSSYAGFTETQRHTLASSRIETFETIWSATLALFGIHLALLGYLMLRRQGWAARIIGVLLGVAGAGYLFNSTARLLLPNLDVDVASVTFVGEVALMVWLLVRGLRPGTRLVS
jgi:hypothetical protein